MTQRVTDRVYGKPPKRWLLGKGARLLVLSVSVGMSGCLAPHGEALHQKEREVAELRQQNQRRREALESSQETVEQLRRQAEVLSQEKARAVQDLAHRQTDLDYQADKIEAMEAARQGAQKELQQTTWALEQNRGASVEAVKRLREANRALEAVRRATQFHANPTEAAGGRISVSLDALTDVNRALDRAREQIGQASAVFWSLRPPGSEEAASQEPLPEALTTLTSKPLHPLQGAGPDGTGQDLPSDAQAGLQKKGALFLGEGDSAVSQGFLGQFYDLARSHVLRLFETGRRWTASDFGFVGMALIALVAVLWLLSIPFRWVLKEPRRRELFLLRRIVGDMDKTKTAPGEPGEVPGASNETFELTEEDAEEDEEVIPEEDEAVVVLESPQPAAAGSAPSAGLLESTGNLSDDLEKAWEGVTEDASEPGQTQVISETQVISGNLSETTVSEAAVSEASPEASPVAPPEEPTVTQTMPPRSESHESEVTSTQALEEGPVDFAATQTILTRSEDEFSSTHPLEEESQDDPDAVEAVRKRSEEVSDSTQPLEKLRDAHGQTQALQPEPEEESSLTQALGDSGSKDFAATQTILTRSEEELSSTRPLDADVTEQPSETDGAATQELGFKLEGEGANTQALEGASDGPGATRDLADSLREDSGETRPLEKGGSSEFSVTQPLKEPPLEKLAQTQNLSLKKSLEQTTAGLPSQSHGSHQQETQPISDIVLHEFAGTQAIQDPGEQEFGATQVIPDVTFKSPSGEGPSEGPGAAGTPTPRDTSPVKVEAGVSGGRSEEPKNPPSPGKPKAPRPKEAPQGGARPGKDPEANASDLSSDQELIAELEQLMGRKLKDIGK